MNFADSPDAFFNDPTLTERVNREHERILAALTPSEAWIHGHHPAATADRSRPDSRARTFTPETRGRLWNGENR